MHPTLQKMLRAAPLFFLIDSPASAQLVSVRTAPVVVAEQFLTFPSQLLGMGGGLALRDLELDPFANPATGIRVQGGRFTSTPTIYNLPANNGFGRTLPVALMYGNGTTFGAASFATQELESAHNRTNWFPSTTPLVRSDRFSHNQYMFGMLGSRLPNDRGAVAFSASYSNLESVHAVDLLYPQAEAIEQDGSITDFRAGFLRELSDDRSLEAVLVRNSVDMEHVVTYVDRTWGPNGQIITAPPRAELNRDRTNTWGAHVKYIAGIPDSKWRAAGAFTANMKTHPKIPNYEFMNIRRDPGNSWALRFGVGAAKSDSVSSWAFDVSYEPAWTYTWAEAADPVARPAGDTLPRGAMTVENDFAFSNTNFHVGWLRHLDRNFEMQLGLGIRRVNYWLDQYNHIAQQPRQQDESWTEITATWGLALTFSSMEIRYFGRRSGGGFVFGGMSDDVPIAVPQPGVDIVAAPSGPLWLDVTTVHTHQLGIAIPFGRKPTM